MKTKRTSRRHKRIPVFNGSSRLLSRLFDPEDEFVDAIDGAEDGVMARMLQPSRRLSYLQRDDSPEEQFSNALC